MIPFSGLLQANTFSASAVGGKAGNHPTAANGLPDMQDPLANFNEASGSFLQWVKKLVDEDTSAAPDGDRVMDLKIDNIEGDLPATDPLQAPIAELTDQPPVPENDPQPPNGEGLEDGQPMMSPVVLNTISVHQEGGQPEDERVRQLWPEPRTDQARKKNLQVAGHIQSGADGPKKQMNTIGNLSPIEKGEGTPVKEDLFALDMKEKMPMEKGGRQDMPVEKSDKQDVSMGRVGKENDPSLFKPVKPAQETEKTSTNHVAPQRPSEKTSTDQVASQRPSAKISTNPVASQEPSAGLGGAEKTVEPKPLHGQLDAGNTRDSESIPRLVRDEETASSEDDSAQFKGRGKGSQTQRMAFAEVKDTELHKDPSWDSVKSSAAEPIKSDPSFQDTAKGMTMAASTTAGGKPTLGQASPLTRPEAPGAGTFQSTVMDQIVEKASLRSIHGRSEVRIRLKPEFLGNVQMNIATDKEQVVVRIITDQTVVKDIIESHLHHLKAELQNQGLTIDKFDVMVNPDADQQPSREQFSQMFKNNSFNESRRQDQNPEKGKTKGGNDADDDLDDRPNRDGVNYFA